MTQDFRRTWSTESFGGGFRLRDAPLRLQGSHQIRAFRGAWDTSASGRSFRWGSGGTVNAGRPIKSKWDPVARLEQPPRPNCRASSLLLGAGLTLLRLRNQGGRSSAAVGGEAQPPAQPRTSQPPSPARHPTPAPASFQPRLAIRVRLEFTLTQHQPGREHLRGPS